METGFIAERARQLKISSISISQSLKMGSFNSAFRGYGVEFDSVREYEIGDDVRNIDWNLTARSGKTYIKEYKEEKDLTIFLCLDFSESMTSGTDGMNPKKKAADIAGLLAFAGLHAACPIGAIFFAGEKGPLFMPHHSEEHILTILKSMEDFAFNQASNLKRGSVLASSIKAVSKILRNRSMVIIISDFKLEGYEKDLGLLSEKNDVICIKLTNSLDTGLPSAGSIQFQDSESNFKTILPTSSTNFKVGYKNNFYEELSRWENICHRSQANPLVIDVTEDPIKILSNFFLSKQNAKNLRKNGANRWKAF